VKAYGVTVRLPWQVDAHYADVRVGDRILRVSRHGKDTDGLPFYRATIACPKQKRYRVLDGPAGPKKTLIETQALAELALDFLTRAQDTRLVAGISTRNGGAEIWDGSQWIANEGGPVVNEESEERLP
jgi:hypothetical protein